MPLTYDEDRTMDFIINEDLRALIPPMHIEDKTALKASILSEGCRDALVVWQETGIQIPTSPQTLCPPTLYH